HAADVPAVAKRRAAARLRWLRREQPLAHALHVHGRSGERALVLRARVVVLLETPGLAHRVQRERVHDPAGPERAVLDARDPGAGLELLQRVRVQRDLEHDAVVPRLAVAAAGRGRLGRLVGHRRAEPGRVLAQPLVDADLDAVHAAAQAEADAGALEHDVVELDLVAVDRGAQRAERPAPPLLEQRLVALDLGLERAVQDAAQLGAPRVEERRVAEPARAAGL